MKALSNIELTTFCSQFALILHSGISTLEGLHIMLDDTPAGDGAKLLENLLDKVEETGSLSLALTSTGCFPEYMCHMTEVGEQSGRLDDVMNSLSKHYRQEEELSQGIRSAVTYPLVMLGMMLAVLLVLIIKVLPVFQQVFEQLGAGLTGISGTILKLGNTFRHYSIFFLVFMVILAVVFFYFFYTSRGRKFLSGFSANFVLTRKLSEKISCSRFARGMYLSLSSGLTMEQSLEMVSQLVEHPKTQQKIQQIQEMISQGDSFPDAIQKTNMFTGLYARMITIGFKTGSVDNVMQQISEQYEDEIQERISKLVSFLEPTLVAILSVAVGMILLSVMLPLMGIMSGMG